MSRDIVLTSDFIRVRHIMLNVDNTRFTTLIIDKPTGHQRYIIE
jgi:hypothetical protein